MNLNLDDCQVEEKSWICPSCKKCLSRKQTLKTHLLVVHGIKDDVPYKRYKVYEYDSSAVIPKRTAVCLRLRNKNNTDAAIDEDVSVTSETETDVAAADTSEIDSAASHKGGASFSHDPHSDMNSVSDISDSSDSEAESMPDTNMLEIIDHVMSPDVQSTSRSEMNSSQDLDSDMDIASSSSDSADCETGEESDIDISDCKEDYDTGDLEATVNNAPLYVIPSSSSIYNAPIGYNEHMLAVSAYVSRHNSSDTEFKDLLALLNLHVPVNNIIETDVTKVKAMCGFEKNFLMYHFYCSICKKVYDHDIDQCQTRGCNGNTDEQNGKNYFVTGDLENQLTHVLTRQGIWQCIQEQFSVTSNSVTDVTSGTEYQKLKAEGMFLSDKNNITLSLFTDGIPLFKSSGISLWPVYLLINELPRKQRFLRKNMILWGVWQGVGKPNMTMFLKPLVQDLNRLYLEGMKLRIDSQDKVCKTKLLLVTMDLQARASVLHMTAHNGAFPCNFCMESGEVVKSLSGKGTNRSFCFKETAAPLRTDVSVRTDAKQAQQRKERINGFKGESVLLYLSDFSLVSNVQIDYMHGILLGITKKMLTLWTETSNSSKPYYIGKCVKDIDKILRNITPPYMISRLPRKLSNMAHWKASELRSWLLFYAIPCLKGRLADVYLVHFSTLVEATYILLGEGITEFDLQRAESLLCAFVKHTEKLYDKAVLGLNFHNLTHLVTCVRQWGPLWAWSCFCFESFNGELKKSVHGTGNVCKQIFWSMQVQKRVASENIPDEGRFGEFIRSMTDTCNSKHSNQYEAYQCLVLESKEIHQDFLDTVKSSLEDMTESFVTSEYEKCTKIIRNGFQMYSKSCSRVKRRNSYTIRLSKTLEDGTNVVEVDHYLVKKDTRHVFAVGRRLKPVQGVMRNRVPHIQQYVYCSNKYEVVKAEFLDTVLVPVEIGDAKYFVAMPNNIEKD